MDVVVTGRHCTISPELKELVYDRIVTVERLRDRVIRVEVEFSASDGTKNPSDAVEVQITLRSRGPVVRAEAKANDKTLAFEQAFDRLKVQLRKAADRRKTHRGLRTAIFTEEIAATPPSVEEEQTEPEENTYEVAGLVVNGDGPLVVREKEFDAVPHSSGSPHSCRPCGGRPRRVSRCWHPEHLLWRARPCGRTRHSFVLPQGWLGLQVVCYSHRSQIVKDRQTWVSWIF